MADLDIPQIKDGDLLLMKIRANLWLEALEKVVEHRNKMERLSFYLKKKGAK